MKNIVFFDYKTSGHHFDYINHILEFVYLNKFFFLANYNITFIINEKYKSIYFDNYLKYSNSNIIFIFIKNNVFVKLSLKFPRFFSPFWLLYLKNIFTGKRIDHLYFLYLNIHIFSLIFFPLGVSYSGILFMPPFRNLNNTSQYKPNNFLKIYIIKLIYKKNWLQNIFILNEDEKLKEWNAYFKGNKFKKLADPVFVLKNIDYIDIRNLFQIPDNIRILFHFGSIEKRKGTLDIIESFNLLGDNIKKLFLVLIIGRFNNIEFYNEVICHINKYNLNKYFIVKNEFVSKDFIASCLKTSSLIMMPYKNVNSSSGVLGWSALYNIPVLGPSKGLLGELISNYELGFVLKNCNPEEIKQFLTSYEVDININGSFFVSTFSLSQFGSNIFYEDGI